MVEQLAMSLRNATQLTHNQENYAEEFSRYANALPEKSFKHVR